MRHIGYPIGKDTNGNAIIEVYRNPYILLAIWETGVAKIIFAIGKRTAIIVNKNWQAKRFF